MDGNEFYSQAEYRDDLGFADLSRAQTSEVTHSYHPYPAKFIPQLARALIEEFSNPGDFLWDPFCGSGTLNLEAYRTGRNSLGTDMSPVSILISRAKTTPLNPEDVSDFVQDLLSNLDKHKIRTEGFYVSRGVLNGNAKLLRVWFSDESLRELGHLLWHIQKSGWTKKYREFAVCAFSAILKRSSFWLSSSVKPQIDSSKTPKEPLFHFRRQIRAMEGANRALFEERDGSHGKVRIFRHDARHKLPSDIGKFDCIITSPPYVVSYDYFDVFRLSTYFLHFEQDYGEFRNSLIGTKLKRHGRRNCDSIDSVQALIDSINETGLRRSLEQYYADMSKFLEKARFHLNEDGRLVVVIGETTLRGIEIPNAFLLNEIARRKGWTLDQLYERDIPARILPSSRDATTGKFTSAQNKNQRQAYKKEYILTLRRD